MFMDNGVCICICMGIWSSILGVSMISSAIFSSLIGVGFIVCGIGISAGPLEWLGFKFSNKVAPTFSLSGGGFFGNSCWGRVHRMMLLLLRFVSFFCYESFYAFFAPIIFCFNILLLIR